MAGLTPREAFRLGFRVSYEVLECAVMTWWLMLRLLLAAYADLLIGLASLAGLLAPFVVLGLVVRVLLALVAGVLI